MKNFTGTFVFSRALFNVFSDFFTGTCFFFTGKKKTLFKYSMLQFLWNVIIAGKDRDLHLSIAVGSPCKWHFFHFSRSPVSDAQSFRILMALASASGVPSRAVSSQKNKGLRRPSIVCSFSAINCIVRANSGFDRGHPYWVPDDDRITSPRLVTNRGSSLYSHHVRLASSGHSLAAKDIIKFLWTVLKAFAESRRRIPQPFCAASRRRDHMAWTPAS